MNKIGFISQDEAEKYDFTLVYQLDGKIHNEKIVDYFNDDGIVIISRKKGIFALDNIGAKYVKIFKYSGEIVYSEEDAKSKMEYIDKLELMIYLYADIVENRQRVDDNLFIDVVTKFKMATFYNPMSRKEDIDSVIEFMKNDVWTNLHGRTYDDYKSEYEIFRRAE